MPHQTAVILIVGLTPALLGEHTPRLSAFAKAARLTRIQPSTPAVTCTVQSSMLTGQPPSVHGIVGNGWYDRALSEIHFWKQSNHLVGAEKVWETARRRDPSVTTANMFWWYNMYSTADYSVTPRPIYKADGRKIPDCYSNPADLRDWLQSQLGPFPLFHFWGPGASIKSSRWIADATKLVHQRHNPTLTLVYLPHLDYALQKLGPAHQDIPTHLRDIDAVAGDLIDYFLGKGVRPIILSEYGIEPVTTPIPINRILREHGFAGIREEQGLELLDPGASRAFAVPDHQIAQVYINDPQSTPALLDLLRQTRGIGQVLHGPARAHTGLDHPRAGDIVLIARKAHWFSYNYWLDDARAPDFARTVDIHRKPGYDPLELFIDPALPFPKLHLAAKLAARKLGFRTLLNLIPLDPTLIRGSHGRPEMPHDLLPVFITQHPPPDLPASIPDTAVRDLILAHLFDPC
jgi:predicted AlkP superfamily pyrophosphatase or phosphodiesterase